MPEAFASHRPAFVIGERHVIPEKQRRDDGKARSSSAQGYGYRWQKLREWFLRKFPLCAECARHDKVTEATEVDHIIPHRGDKKLFWDVKNLQSLCEMCHSKKTSREDGGFGNKRRD